MKKRYLQSVFCLAIFCASLSMAGCGQQTESWTEKFGTTIKLDAISEIEKQLGLPEGNLQKMDSDGGAELYSADGCTALLPAEIPAGEQTALSVLIVDGKTVRILLEHTVAGEPDPSEVYRVMAAQSEELKKAFPDSAFERYYEGISSVSGEEPLPFTSCYPDEQAYLTGWEKVTGGEKIGLQGEEWQWVDEQAGLMMGTVLYSTSGGTRYSWEVQGYNRYQDYLYANTFTKS